MDASERFERVAEAFDNATGYPAIGKDAGSARYGGEAWQAQRMALWLAFRAGYDFAVRIAAEHQRSDSTVRDTTGGAMTPTPNDYAEALEHIAGVMAYHLYHHDAALLRTLATAMREGRPHLDPVAPGDFVLTLPPKEAP